MVLLECRDPMKILVYDVMVDLADQYAENARIDLVNKIVTALDGD